MRAKDRQKPSFFTGDEVCMRFSLDRGIYPYLLERFFELSAAATAV
jgi:hypothetical protein